MNEIEKLIKELCPDGVEFREVQELFELKTGYTPSTKNQEFWQDGTIPWFRLEDIRTNGRILDFALQSVSESAVKGKGVYPSNSLIVSTLATIGEHALIKVPFLANQQLTVLILKDQFKEQLDMHFAYYYAFLLGDWCKKNVRQASFASVDMTGFRKFKFPVPPLEVQEKIVKVLDKMTQLEAALEAELSLRRQQYEYYRNALLTFDLNGGGSCNPLWARILELCPDGVEFRRLGETMLIARGASPRPIQNFLTNDKNGIPWIKIGDVNPREKYITQTLERITLEGAEKSRYLKKGDFVLSNSMSFGRPYILGLEGCIHDGWISMSNFESVFIPDFLYHLLRSEQVQKYWKMRASSGTVSNLNADIVRATPVPVPPLEIQEQIVEILDKFDKLTNDLTEGLPAEIEARRQQYEYYRNRLLSFPEKTAKFS